MERTETMKALTIKQPWAELIAMGAKDIENRSWPTRHRGQLVIHAGKSWDKEGTEIAAAHGVTKESVQFGCVIGTVDVIEMTTESSSEWFTGPVGWILKNARRLEVPVFMRGRLGLWKCPFVDRDK